MKRTMSVVLATLMIASLVAMVPLGTALAQSQDDSGEDADEDIRPGERLSGVVGVQAAEIDGEVEARSFGIAISQAESNEERADLVAQRLDRNQDRLMDLDRQQDQLREHRDAGNMSNGMYQARMAQHAATVQTVNRTTNQGAAVAGTLPDDVVAERQIDAERVHSLRTQARNMSGPEVAEMARGIAGPNVGGPMGPPEDRPDRMMGPNGEGPVGDQPGDDARPDRDQPVNDSGQSQMTDGNVTESPEGGPTDE